MVEDDIGRPTHGPDPAEGAFEDGPVEAAHEYYSRNGRSSGVWECSPGRILEEEHADDEFCTILSGRVKRFSPPATASSCPKGAASPGWSMRRFASST
jgi:uncharacterized cupin superfamily protein